MEGPRDKDNLHNRTKYWKSAYLLGNVTEERKENRMNIKRSSWHYRLYKWFWQSEPTSLCPYFWKTLLAPVFGPFSLALEFIGKYAGYFAAIGIVVIFGGKIGAGLNAAYLSGQLWRDVIFIIQLLLTLTCILAFACGTVWTLFVGCPKVAQKIRSTDSWQLFYGYYRAVKDRICPLITVVD